MKSSLLLADLSSTQDLIILAIVACMGLLQVATLVAFFIFRAEMRSELREVFAELKAYNRSLGILEGLEKRVTHFEELVGKRIENIESRLGKSSCNSD